MCNYFHFYVIMNEWKGKKKKTSHKKFKEKQQNLIRKLSEKR